MLRHYDQVHRLAQVFGRDFGFATQVEELDNAIRDPQQQLNDAIRHLIADGHGPSPRNLIIVYYAGHATLTSDGQLMLNG